MLARFLLICWQVLVNSGRNRKNWQGWLQILFWCAKLKLKLETLIWKGYSGTKKQRIWQFDLKIFPPSPSKNLQNLKMGRAAAQEVCSDANWGIHFLAVFFRVCKYLRWHASVMYALFYYCERKRNMKRKLSLKELREALKKGNDLQNIECDWEKLNGWDWSWLLSTQPQFADKCKFLKQEGD